MDGYSLVQLGGCMLYYKTADQSVSLTLLNKAFCTLILKFRLYIFCFLSVVLNTPLYILYSTLGKVPSAAQS